MFQTDRPISPANEEIPHAGLFVFSVDGRYDTALGYDVIHVLFTFASPKV